MIDNVNIFTIYESLLNKKIFNFPKSFTDNLKNKTEVLGKMSNCRFDEKEK